MRHQLPRCAPHQRALTERFGIGHWSGEPSERAVLAGFRQATVILAIDDGGLVATMRLSTRKPWAIDRTLFTPVPRPLYLTDMAVRPSLQRRGIGRACLTEAERVARAFPAQAIWLDAYDAEAGAAEFYASCGYRECGRRTYRETPLVYFERAVDSYLAFSDLPSRS
ncbi:MAG: GNAT family N-acetyltransferase [Gemmatimonadaceae bacterium]|nr:GNAT family N-acetyltransferase [Gemmatimonadaceae bacterium]